LYGEEYKTCVTNPYQVIVGTSRSFRMQEPKEQAELFKLFSWVLYYLASSYSRVGYLATDEEWNPHYQVEYGLNVRTR
jgi:hypothetical protein